MSGELSSKKSEHFVWVGFVDDGFSGDGSSVAVFGTESAAAEALHQGAVDKTKKFPLYDWLPPAGHWFEYISRVSAAGEVTEIGRTEYNHWPWQMYPEVAVVSSAPVVNVYGTDLRKVQAKHNKLVKTLQKPAVDDIPAKSVEALAVLLEAAADHPEELGWEAQARALLATGQVVVTP